MVISDAQALSPQQARCLAALAGLSYRGRTLADYLRTICVHLTDLLGGGLAAVTLYRDGGKHVLAVAPGDQDLCTVYNPEGEISSYVVESGAPLRIADGREERRFGRMPDGYFAYMGVPLVPPDGTTIGTVCYFDTMPRRFSDAELDIALLFAERAATSIDNFSLYQRLAALNEGLQEQVAARTAELRAAQAQLIRRERLAAIGEFASAIGHEIRTPLSTICLNLDSLARMPLVDTAQRRVALSHKEANRLAGLVNELLDAAKPVLLRPTRVELAAFLPDVLGLLRDELEQRQQTINIHIADEASWVNADRDKLTQVVINLARNASEAAPNGSTISWHVDALRDLPLVRLSLHNVGEPIPAEILPRLTQAFVTTKPQGTGLGLMVVKSIVEAHGGDVMIRSNAEEGTIVSLTLPREPT